MLNVKQGSCEKHLYKSGIAFDHAELQTGRDFRPNPTLKYSL